MAASVRHFGFRRSEPSCVFAQQIVHTMAIGDRIEFVDHVVIVEIFKEP